MFFHWLGFVAVAFGEAFNLTEWRASYRNGFLDECVWFDLAAMAGGGLGLVCVLVFYFSQVEETTGIGGLFRLALFGDAIRLIAYGFGVDVGIEAPCDATNFRAVITPGPMLW